MGVTSERLPNQLARSRAATSQARVFMAFVYGITFILAALAIHQVVSLAMSWSQHKLDDLHYGRPRTMHLEGVVGHEDTESRPTHFIALNLDRQVVVLELPGGDASKVRSLPGPYLFGDNQELTPVILSLHDVDHDGHPDLLINVRNEQIVYLNKEGSFRLPTAEEQTQLMQEQGP